MASDVSPKVSWMGEASIADVTLEWFFSCVNVHVPIQDTLCCEAFVALRTLHRHQMVRSVIGQNVSL